MPFGLPMRVVSLDGGRAVCEHETGTCNVGLALGAGETVNIGDYVLVRDNAAVRKVAADEAFLTGRIMNDLLG